MDKLLALLGAHHHYYGVPHRDQDGKIIQTCYDCGKTRKVKVRFV